MRLKSIKLVLLTRCWTGRSPVG